MFLKATVTDEGQEIVLREEYEDLAASWLTVSRRVVSVKTTGRRLTSIRAFAKWAGWGDILDDYDAPTPAKSVPHPLPEGMTGVRRLIEVASNESQRSLIVLCGMVGCRVAEALEVRPEHFNLQNKTVTIRGKGDKQRVVPVSTEAWAHLQVPVLHAFSRGSTVVNLHDRHARKIITSLGIKAGLQRSISSHDLRATFGTHVYDRTKDIRAVQELLGHASSNTTELYIGVTQSALRKAVEL
jgi:integrase/recombinase XerD